MIRRSDAWPLGGIGFILAVSASWWALALWSVPGAPDWLERTRSVCFNITESGLPDAKGWILLLGQPPTMLALLLVGWGREVRDSIRHLMSSLGGKALMGGTLALAMGGLGWAATQVAEARLPDVVFSSGGVEATDQPRLDRAWPILADMVDQAGSPFTLASLDRRPALVTFAFGHCETVCPVVVHEARAARLALGGDIAIVVFTVDPWRDTPGQLQTVLRQFELDPSRDYVVGGPVESVASALSTWDVQTERDLQTGDIVHPAVVYLVEADGTVAYASGGGAAQMVSLGDLLDWRTAAP
jgi:cytochrome oxidase Cu insertion factor (SCO1/SenC/PrrC family)